MIDRTNVSVAPLMTGTSYIATTGVPSVSLLPIQPQIATTIPTTASIQVIPTTTTYQQYVPTTTNYTTNTNTFVDTTTTDFNIPQETTSYVDTQFLPETTVPDQTVTEYLPDAFQTTDVQEYQTTTNTPQYIESTPEIIETTPEIIDTTPITTEIPQTTSYVEVPTQVVTDVQPQVQVQPQPQPQPQQSQVNPILDEDFQRGRPIYDEISEDRYRNFKFGRP